MENACDQPIVNVDNPRPLGPMGDAGALDLESLVAQDHDPIAVAGPRPVARSRGSERRRLAAKLPVPQGTRLDEDRVLRGPRVDFRAGRARHAHDRPVGGRGGGGSACSLGRVIGPRRVIVRTSSTQLVGVRIEATRFGEAVIVDHLGSVQMDRSQPVIYDREIELRLLYEDPDSGAEHYLIRYPAGLRAASSAHCSSHDCRARRPPHGQRQNRRA